MELEMLITKRLGTLLSSVAANAAEASRTVIVDATKASSVGFTFSLARGIGNAMWVQYRLSHDQGATYGDVVSKSVTDGLAVAKDYSEWFALLAETAKSMETSIECQAATHVKAIFGVNGGDGADLITVIGSTAQEV
jgi:uncharacterized membrane-anchored protein